MTVAIKCKKCSWEKFTYFQRGDYIHKTIIDNRKEHDNCDGEVTIEGIFLERKETPEEKKWKEYISKFK